MYMFAVPMNVYWQLTLMSVCTLLQQKITFP